MKNIQDNSIFRDIFTRFPRERKIQAEIQNLGLGLKNRPVLVAEKLSDDFSSNLYKVILSCLGLY